MPDATTQGKRAEVDGVPVYCAFDKAAPIDELVPHPQNPNRHPEEQLAMLAKIIRGNGWRLPITVSLLSGFVVRGHGRLEAASRLGLKEVPVDYQHYDNEVDEKADLVADNTVPELSYLDDGALAGLVSNLNDAGFDLGLTGLGDEQLHKLLDTPDVGLPDPLPDPGVEGDDTRSQRFIIVFSSDAEKQRLMKVLGIDGAKVMYLASEIPAAAE